MAEGVAVGRLPSKKFIALSVFWLCFLVWNAWDFLGFKHVIAAALDLSAILAGLFLAGLIVNPLHWYNGKRAAFGCIAVAAMLARLTLPADLIAQLIQLPAHGVNLFGLLVVFAVAPPLMVAWGSLVIIALFMIVLTVMGVFMALPSLIFGQIRVIRNELATYRYEVHGLAGFIGGVLRWLHNEPEPVAPPDESKGARMATAQEIVALHKPNAPESMAFGHVTTDVPLFLKTEKHVLVMASTRSGKGVTLIIPHLLRYEGSAFVLDPKGENARATGRRRADLNQQVHYLDPFGISGKPPSRFNPLNRFTPETMEADAKALASALFIKGEKRDHWEDAGEQLVALLIMYVFLAAPPAQRDLYTVRKALLSPLRMKDGPPPLGPDGKAKQRELLLLDQISIMDDGSGLLNDLAASFLSVPENEFGSIVSSATRQTDILDNPQIIATLRATGQSREVDFADWHNGTMTVFLCLSAPKFPTFNRWLRLILTAALDEMTDKMQPPRLPVCFMLDELATLGHLQSVENAVGLAAGYGVQLVTVFQDVAQMRALYKGRWASFIGNAGVRALFNLDDIDTAEYWSKFMGGRLVETRSVQRDGAGLEGQNASIGEAMRPLISADKIMMDFAAGRMLVLAQGAHPITTRRVAYFADNGLAGLWDDPRGPVTPHSAPSGRPASAPRATAETAEPQPTQNAPRHAPAAVTATFHGQAATPAHASHEKEAAEAAHAAAAAAAGAGAAVMAAPAPKDARPRFVMPPQGRT
jgi:type IV secretion system protein VirD4